MRTLIDLLGGTLTVLRTALFPILLVAAALAALSWAVRSRRVGPFSGAARFSRRVVDPLLAPLERALARRGIIGAGVPWWGLLALLVGSAGLIYLLEFVQQMLLGAFFAANAGPVGVVILVIRWGFAILELALLVRVLLSWFGGTYHAVGRLTVRLTEWFLGPLRRVLPPLGMVDISPIVAYFGLRILQGLVLQLFR